MQRRRLVMAEHRVGAAGEHRRAPAAVQREAGMADRVHPPVDPEQPPALAHSTDRRFGESERFQLAGRDHAVLVSGKPRQGCVD